jgi:hypothetical protein
MNDTAQPAGADSDYALPATARDPTDFAGTRAVDRWNRLSEVCALSVDLGGRLYGDLGCVPALGGLLGHAEHRSDLRPGTIRMASIADGIEQGHVDIVSLFHQFSDRPKRCRLRLNQVVGVDVVGPPLECVGAL